MESFARIRDVFGSKEPKTRADFCWEQSMNYKYRDYCNNKCAGEDPSSPFFQYLYTIVPSVWGSSKSPTPSSDEAQELLDEIALARRCRELSTYTQVATLLCICRSSRVAAQDYNRNMIPNTATDIYRGVGPACRPRPLRSWQKLYDIIINMTTKEVNDEKVDGEGFPLCSIGPKICLTLDLAVLRLHTSSGHTIPGLRRTPFQYWLEGDHLRALPCFYRIGLEWHPLWTTPEGEKEFCADVVHPFITHTASVWRTLAQLYWLVDGIPRPKWDQYPPAIPAAFNKVIGEERDDLSQDWNMDEAHKESLLRHHDLYQEFEANGRRYYVVFVVTNWKWKSTCQQPLLDPAVNWEKVFPGGKDLWPKGLHDPVEFAHKNMLDIGANIHCTYILSWEPI